MSITQHKNHLAQPTVRIKKKGRDRHGIRMRTGQGWDEDGTRIRSRKGARSKEQRGWSKAPALRSSRYPVTPLACRYSCIPVFLFRVPSHPMSCLAMMCHGSHACKAVMLASQLSLSVITNSRSAAFARSMHAGPAFLPLSSRG